MSTKLGIEHVRRVRVLYKTILRLHRGLPDEIRSLGDSYVKDEFRRHKDAEVNFIPIFMKEWTNYALTIAKQLRQQGRGSRDTHFGSALSQKEFSAMSDEQIAQLHELYQETQKPRDPDDPLGANVHPLSSCNKDS